MSAAPRQRLFFALWPDEDVRAALAAMARSSLGRADGRPVPVDNLHLTLAFLGSIDEATRRCAERAAEGVSAPAFTLELVRVGRWPRSRVLWAAPEETPDALSGLASTLNGALRACGHEPDARPFRAHVTLARKVRPRHAHEGAKRAAPVRWPVDAFHLVASQTHPDGARYRRIRSWPLG